ncbi:zinc ribbon domain-containing protein [Massilia sp. CFBP9026]|uniref:zinc ribbon domain-containing protein n=1 Tax=Massilia sp. CFBP9026 TaxID=3096536 RepID=UPI002A6B7FA7|nr:zinc ribbon domain-containing protein [Massilia sp. CFBP9026]MDY0962235.1 zinc ribbon domain-containing protein [Massilia sp. CFBP9026]
MFCSHCGAQMAPDAAYCSVCGKAAGAGPVNLDKPSAPAPHTDGGIPDGVKGWSWGAFLLNWIWAIGNRSWIGLLALVPYVGWIVVFWLGFKGREMAWKNKQWDSLEHFNRVQRKWSQWGIGITIAAIVLAVLAAMFAPDAVDLDLDADRTVTVQRSEALVRANDAAVTARGLIDSNADNLPASLSTVAGLLDRRTNADGSRAVTLGGKVLFSGEDAGWQFPLRSFTLSGGKEAILMASSGGRGASCETMFFFLLADASGVKPTPMFGTCAARGSFVQRGDAIELELPDVNGASTIVLEDGVVVEDGQVVSLTGMNDPSR